MADPEDMPPTGPLDDTGETGRNRIPPDEQGNGTGDFMAHDELDGFFAELERQNRGEEIVPRAEPVAAQRDIRAAWSHQTDLFAAG